MAPAAKAPAPKAPPAPAGGLFGLGSNAPVKAAVPPLPPASPKQAAAPAPAKAPANAAVAFFPTLIGEAIEPQWVEGKEFRKGGKIEKEDLVIIKRSDGSLRYGEVLGSAGFPWQQAYEIAVEVDEDGLVIASKSETSNTIYTLITSSSQSAAPAPPQTQAPPEAKAPPPARVGAPPVQMGTQRFFGGLFGAGAPSAPPKVAAPPPPAPKAAAQMPPPPKTAESLPPPQAPPVAKALSSGLSEADIRARQQQEARAQRQVRFCAMCWE